MVMHGVVVGPHSSSSSSVISRKGIRRDRYSWAKSKHFATILRALRASNAVTECSDVMSRGLGYATESRKNLQHKLAADIEWKDSKFSLGCVDIGRCLTAFVVADLRSRNHSPDSAGEPQIHFTNKLTANTNHHLHPVCRLKIIFHDFYGAQKVNPCTQLQHIPGMNSENLILNDFEMERRRFSAIKIFPEAS